MKRAKARKSGTVAQTFPLGTGVSVTFRLPASAVGHDFLEDAIGDLKAAYERALERSWEQFDRKTGSKYSKKAQGAS